MIRRLDRDELLHFTPESENGTGWSVGTERWSIQRFREVRPTEHFCRRHVTRIQAGKRLYTFATVRLP